LHCTDIKPVTTEKHVIVTWGATTFSNDVSLGCANRKHHAAISTVSISKHLEATLLAKHPASNDGGILSITDFYHTSVPYHMQYPTMQWKKSTPSHVAFNEAQTTACFCRRYKHQQSHSRQTSYDHLTGNQRTASNDGIMNITHFCHTSVPATHCSRPHVCNSTYHMQYHATENKHETQNHVIVTWTPSFSGLNRKLTTAAFKMHTWQAKPTRAPPLPDRSVLPSLNPP
jgi:hypothetical protein